MRKSSPRLSAGNYRLIVICAILIGLVSVGISVSSNSGDARLEQSQGAATQKNGPANVIASVFNFPMPLPSLTVTMTGQIVAPDGGEAGKAGVGEKIRYTVTINNTSPTDPATSLRLESSIDPNTTLVGGSIVTSPLAASETYQSVGNMTLTSSAIGADCNANPLRSVTCNDTLRGATLSGFGDTLANANATAPGSTLTITGKGTVVLNSDGTFVFNPVAAFEGDVEFWYTLTNSTVTPNLKDTAKVTIQVGGANGLVWFVSTSGGNNNTFGTQANPLSLAGFNTINTGVGNNPADNDAVFLFEGAHTGPVTLRAGQKFIGQDFTGVTANALGAPAPKLGNSYPADTGTAVTITSSTGNGINLNSGNALAGFTVGNVGAAGTDTAISGTAVGNLSVRQVIINTNRQALAISSSGNAVSDATYTGFTSVTTNGGTNSISLQNMTGTLNLGGGAISGAGGQSIVIGDVGPSSGGSITVNYTGTIASKSGGNNVVAIKNKTSGTVNFSGAVSGGFAGTGVLLLNNTGATINFTGGLTLNTGAGAAFSATGGGTVSVTGGSNTISTTTGQAVVMSGVSIGSSNISLSTIGVTGSPTSLDALSFSNVSGPGSFNGGNVTVAGTTTAGDGIEINGSAAAFNFSGATIDNTAGAGINLVGSNGTVTFTNVNIDGTGTAGISISNNINPVSISGGTVGSTNDPAGNVVDIDQGSANVTIAANLTKNSASAGRMIEITNRTGINTVDVTGSLNCTSSCTGINVQNITAGTSTINFSNGTKTFSTGASTAVNLDNIGNATVNFSGGGLAITTSSGMGFNATAGAAAINVTGTVNTINSTGATALNVANSNIGASGLTFQSISAGTAASGPSNGIVLNTTGSSGGLTVTGGALAGSGGTIQKGATGISLNSTRNVSLTRMQLNDFTDWAIRGSSVVNFTMANTVISGINGNNAGTDDGSVRFTELTGSASITNCNISGGYEDNFAVVNTTGTLDRILFDVVTIGANGTAEGGDALFLQADGTATIKATVEDSFFTSARGDLFQFSVRTNGNNDLIYQRNTLTNNHSNIVSGGGGFSITSANTPRLTYNISNNTFKDAVGSALIVGMDGTNGVFTGTITNNVIGEQGAAVRGSSQGHGMAVGGFLGGGTHSITITNNQVYDYTNNGIHAVAGEGGTGTGRLDLTIQGNTVAEANAAGGFIFDAIRAMYGTTAGHQFRGCVIIGGTLASEKNTLTGHNGINEIRLFPRFNSTVAVPGFTTTGSPASDGAAMNTFLELRNNMTAGKANGSNSSTIAYQNNCGSLGSLFNSTGNRSEYFALNDSSQNSNNSLLAFLNKNDFSSTDEFIRQVLSYSGAQTRETEALKGGAEALANAPFNVTSGTSLPDTSSIKAEIEKGAEFELAHSRKIPTLGSRVTSFISTIAGVVAPSAHAAPAPMPALEVNESLGTLPANKSVTVVFDVTVNGPHPYASYTNNATVKADDIANIPKQVTTTGDRYNNTTTLSASPTSPGFSGDNITFTATVTPSEAVGVINPATGGFVQFKDGGVAMGAPVACTADGNNCKAELQTNSLSQGAHSITAEYTGTHHEDSASSALNYTINTCTNSPVVTTVADNTAPVPAGSLREALANVCPNAPNNVITFATGAGQAFDPATGPHVIQLAAALPAITKNVIVQGPGANMLEVRGSQTLGSEFRVFTVDSSATNVQMSGLTISGGSVTVGVGGGGISNAGNLTLSDCAVGTPGNTNIATIGSGGGIYNSGTLTIERCTISNNVATVSGGGIFNAALATLTVKNSTISRNTSQGGANTGGGVNNAGTATFTNVTVAANLLGGGITNANVATMSFTIGNTIVADSAGGSDDLTGVFHSAGYNLFENAGTATIGGTTTGNQTGVDPKLGALFNNGGPTLTHALMMGSPALDAGDNTLATNAGLTTTDQRGTGFNRMVDSADSGTTQTVDIGAYEAIPTISDIPNKTDALEDTPVTGYSFNVGDAAIGIDTITASATTDPSGVIQSVTVNNATTATPDLTITPVSNKSGTATITVTVNKTINGHPLSMSDTFDITFNAVNDVPVTNNDPNYSTDEDVALTVNTASGVLANDTDSDSPSLTAVIVTNPSNAQSFTLNSDGSFSYTPASNFNGQDSFTYKANDGTNDGNTATVTITVNAVNDPIGTVAPGAITVNEDSTNNAVASMSITDVDATLAPNGVYVVTLSSTQGTMSLATIAGLTFTAGSGTADTSMTFHGTLASINTALATATYTPDANYSGSAQIKLDATDLYSGTVATGTGAATADGNTIVVTVTAQNDAPALTNNGLTVNEGSTANTIGSGALSLSDDDNPAATSLVFQLASVPANGMLKKSGTAMGVNDTFTQEDINNNRITYDHNGSETTSDSFNFTATDGTNNIASTAFNITVTPQNDVPTVGTNAGLTVVPATTGTIDSTKLSVTDPDNTAADLVYTVGTTTANGTLKNGGTQLNGGDTFTQQDILNNQITYSHNGGVATTDSFTFTVSDGAGGSIGLTTFNININCVASTVVTVTADNGPGSLREAIQTACAGNTITFNLDSSTDPGYDSVTDTFTIKLTTGELSINRNLTINGPTNQRVIISGNNTDANPANRSRVFNVASGSTVVISNLTIANGESQFGGGIYNLGNLTLNQVTLTGNKAVANLGAGGDGGAIDSDSGSLTIYNSTISGNTADGGGGGIHNCGDSTATLLNVTITGNRSDADDLSPGEGGGLEQVSSNSLTLNNTIVAGNRKGNAAPVANDIDVFGPGGIVLANSKNNLIGDAATSGGITNGGAGANIVGNSGAGTIDINTVLDTALANNGGPTRTHKLLPGSLAINNGSDAAVDAIPLGTDQRGSGFNRKVGTVDMGAYEVQAGIADRLAFNVQPSNANAGVAITPAVTVRILDVLGNLTTSTANVTLAIGTNPSAGTLSGTTTVAAVNGTATFSDLSINNIGAGYTLTASSTGLAGATSNAFNIVSASIVSGTKTVSGSYVIGQTVTYTITLSNSSPGAQLNNPGDEFTDVLPAGLTLVSASASSGTAVATVGTNTVTWNGVIPGNSSVTITINATINAGTSGQTISNQGGIAFDANGDGTNEAAALTDDPGVAGANNPTSFIVNAAPTVTPVGVTRKAGDAGSNVTIANVNDLEDAENTLAVTVNNGASATVNGVTVSGLSVSAAGVVTANVEAACGATSAGFTLKVADSGGLSNTGTLNVTVNPNTAPTLSYSTQAVDVNGSLNFNPATGPSDSNTINSITVLNAGTYTGGISVNNSTGAISITNAAPAGSHTITIRATDACGLSTDAQFTLNVNKISQTITFNPNPLPDKTYGDADFTVNATASSNLSVSFAASGQCTVNGNLIHITGPGSCTITASQPGNSTYNAAGDVLRTFNIAKGATTTAISSSANPSAPGQNVTLTATVSGGGATPTGMVQFKVDNVNQGAPVALNGSGSATFSSSSLAVGTHTVTAEYSGDANYNASTGTLSGGQVVSINANLTINDVTVTEGNSGTANAVFTVTLSSASNVAVTVDYATANGTATTADNDYQSATGTLTFAIGETTKTVTVPVNGDTKNEPSETFLLNLTNAQNANVADNQGQGTITNDDAPTVQLSSSTYTINEGANNTPQGFTSLAVDIVRSGDTSGPATVKYITSDQSGGNECNQVTGQASQRCDYILVGATLRFAAGETTKTIQIPIVNDGYQEGAEFLSIELTDGTGVTVGTPSQATITIQDDAADATPTTSANNPYLSNPFFVRQNYLDFLGRDADQNGFTDWTSVLNNCGPQQGFLGSPKNCDRAHVSHGFFASPEFTRSGFRIYRLFEVGMNRLPLYREFIPDMASLSGFNQTPAQEQQNLADYLQEFTSKQEFINRFQDVSQPAQAALFIERLEQTAGVTLPATTTTLAGQPPQYGRQELINKRASGQFSLGETLMAFVEQKVVYDRFFQRGHVTMLYFAYLRRDPSLNDPNLSGWNDWVNVFTNGGQLPNGTVIQPMDIHHLIFGFIYSEEYRKRFGQP